MDGGMCWRITTFHVRHHLRIGRAINQTIYREAGALRMIEPFV